MMMMKNIKKKSKQDRSHNSVDKVSLLKKVILLEMTEDQGLLFK